MNKKAISCILSAAVIINSLSLAGCSGKDPSTVLAADGEQIASITSVESGEATYQKEEYFAYVDFVVSEATEILSELKGTDSEKAQKELINGGYTVSTLFDAEVLNKLSEAYLSKLSSSVPFGAAVTDLKGGLTAVYSGGNSNETTNFATAKNAPYSAFKPLSVYTPAMEKKLINWSYLFKDSPFKQIKDESGSTTDWPTNSSGRYTNKNMTVGEAVKKSVNTVSVKCLDKLTVESSLDFLNNAFGLKLDLETQKAESMGDEEIYGNLAMGYLMEGVSPIDMAGYYQVFANDGKYAKPYAITKITDSDGNTVYEAEVTEKQAVSSETAFIMNRMLQTVVSKGGTGEKAAVSGVQIGGKTGTGTTNDLKGNWFVGFTPQYTCAVWHGGDESNIAPDIFGNFASKQDNSVRKHFSLSRQVTQVIYCAETGKRISSGCTNIEEGYFSTDNIPEVCDGHSR